MLSETSNLFKALSDPNRLRIVAMLQFKPLCVCEITSVLGLAASTVSKHLTLLRQAAIITDTKEGKWVIYSLNKQMDEQREKLVQLLPLLFGDDTQIDRDRSEITLVDRNESCSNT